MSTSRSRTSASEEGTGLVASVAGVAVFLVLTLFATQVLFDLYARSAVSAAALDAARVVAGSDGGATPASVADAEQGARSSLGHFGSGARFAWGVTPDEVDLTIRVRSPSLLPRALTGPMGIDQVSESARIRRERVR